jgi:hypothetical protein
MAYLHGSLTALAATLSFTLLAACSPSDTSTPAANDANGAADAAAPSAAAPAAGGAETAAAAVRLAPFKPVATVQELMNGPIQWAADAYWQSVSITVDLEGTHENFPESDDEWHDVWAAALTVAESGNLLMMAPRAQDDRVWMRLSEALVTVGLEAAEAAKAQDTDKVFDAGEKVYNVCTTCHELYAPEPEVPE